MKLILILGTSLSAAGLAAGFALIANQALSRESAVIEPPYRSILPSRVTPDLSVASMPAAPARRAQAQAMTQDDEMTLAAVATSGNAAIPADRAAKDMASLRLIPLIATPLAERPPRRPVQMAYGDPMGEPGSALTEYRPIPAKNFQDLPLIGVYR